MMKFAVILGALICVIKCSGDVVSLPCYTDNDCEDLSSSSKCINQFCECIGDCNLDVDETVVTKLGESCLKLQDCNVNGSYCLMNKCTCKNGSVSSADKKMCLKVAEEIGSNCVEDEQCIEKIPQSICKNNKCACGSSMQLHQNMCIANKSLGESCDISEECTTEFSECNVSCRCIQRYVSSGHRCLLLSKTILSPCSENIQCEMTLGGGSECVDELCNCRDLYQFKTSSNKCIRDILLDEVCSTHEQCHQPGHGPSRLECILGQCKCQSSYIQVNDFCIAGAARISFSTIAYISLILSPYLIL